MPFLQLSYEEIDAILTGTLPDNARKTLAEARQAPTERERQIIDMARDNSRVREGELEIDDLCEGLPMISEGDDNGCYVQSWLWVDFDGTVLDKESEEGEVTV